MFACFYLLLFPLNALAASGPVRPSQLAAASSILVSGSILICVATVVGILLVLVTMRLRRRQFVEDDDIDEPSA